MTEAGFEFPTFHISLLVGRCIEERYYMLQCLVRTYEHYLYFMVSCVEIGFPTSLYNRKGIGAW